MTENREIYSPYADVQLIREVNRPLHCTHHISLVYCYSGELTVNIDYRKNVLTAGYACFILPNQAFDMSGDDKTKCFIGEYSIDYLPKLNERYGNRYSLDQTFIYSGLGGAISKLSTGTDNIYRTASILCSIFAEFSEGREFMLRDSKYKFFIDKTLQYVENNFNKSPSLIELSSILGYNSHYVSNIIGKRFGKNFSQLVNEYRVQYAINMIKSGENSITDISTLCGFESIRSFNRNFLNVTGRTPSEYRAELNSQQ